MDAWHAKYACISPTLFQQNQKNALISGIIRYPAFTPVNSFENLIMDPPSWYTVHGFLPFFFPFFFLRTTSVHRVIITYKRWVNFSTNTINYISLYADMTVRHMFLVSRGSPTTTTMIIVELLNTNMDKNMLFRAIHCFFSSSTFPFLLVKAFQRRQPCNSKNE